MEHHQIVTIFAWFFGRYTLGIYIYFDNGNKSYALNILNDGLAKFPDDKKLHMAKLSLFKTCGDTKNYVEFKTIVDEKFKAK